jgi:hypothetical protein
MAESSLTLDLQKLRLFAVEQFYGGAGDYSALSSDEQSRVDRNINAGLRTFYSPPSVDGVSAHEWSFLRPITTLTLQAPYSTGTIAVASGVVTLTGGTFPSWAASGRLSVNGTEYEVNTRDSGTQVTLVDTSVTVSSGATYELFQDDYSLGDDFERLLSPVTYNPGGSNKWALTQVPESVIREWRAEETSRTGTQYPTHFAIRSVANDPTVGTRSLILFYPSVATTAVLEYQYKVRPSELTTTNKYAWGASDHSETIKDAVLASFEMHLDGQPGVFAQKFQQSLMASIARDRRANMGGLIGQMQDGSDGTYSRWARRPNGITVTFHGVTPT